METFFGFRDSIPASAEATGWPPVTVAGIGCIETEVSWRATVQLATADELIALSRALAALAA